MPTWCREDTWGNCRDAEWCLLKNNELHVWSDLVNVHVRKVEKTLQASWLNCIVLQLLCLCWKTGDCKVAGSNLTCRDDSKTRWRLHSVGPTSSRLSSLGQNERLHISLQQCQERLKTCLIVKYGVSEAVSTKTPVFLRCLTLSG